MLCVPSNGYAVVCRTNYCLQWSDQMQLALCAGNHVALTEMGQKTFQHVSFVCPGEDEGVIVIGPLELKKL